MGGNVRVVDMTGIDRDTDDPIAEQTRKRRDLNLQRYNSFKIGDKTDLYHFADPWHPWRGYSLRTLRGFQPLQLRFHRTHPDGDWADTYWFALHADLYWRVHNFAARFFRVDAAWPESFRRSPWARGRFTREFCEATKLVATQDPLTGGWDAILTDPQRRICLVIGIIARVLDEEVFQALLFGADAEQDAMLATQDMATLDLEGYGRTDVRSRSIRATMHSAILTPKFWPEVDRLATRTTALLLPLIKLLDEVFVGTDLPAWSLREIHQEIHNIVSNAGYLAVCMGRSKTIFRTVFPDVGQQWSVDMGQAHAEPYGESRAAAQAVDAKAKDIFEKHKVDQKDFYRGPMRMAKVQVVLWPSIKRYTPVGQLEGSQTACGEKISSIMKAQVIFYAGVLDEDAPLPIPGLRRTLHLHEIARDLAGVASPGPDGGAVPVAIRLNPLATTERNEKNMSKYYKESFTLDEHIPRARKYRRRTDEELKQRRNAVANSVVFFLCAVLVAITWANLADTPIPFPDRGTFVRFYEMLYF